jgi:hypothetical protein
MLNLFATVKVEDRSGKDVTQRINWNYSLDILNGKSKMLRTGSVVREGQSFGAAIFENI